LSCEGNGNSQGIELEISETAPLDQLCSSQSNASPLYNDCNASSATSDQKPIQKTYLISMNLQNLRPARVDEVCVLTQLSHQIPISYYGLPSTSSWDTALLKRSEAVTDEVSQTSSVSGTSWDIAALGVESRSAVISTLSKESSVEDAQAGVGTSYHTERDWSVGSSPPAPSRAESQECEEVAKKEVRRPRRAIPRLF
jgi:hypothetical protein